MKRVKEVNGKKILYKYGWACWLSILFSLIAIAVPVLMIFLFPTWGKFQDPSALLGLEVIKRLFTTDTPNLAAFATHLSETLDFKWYSQDTWGVVVNGLMAGGIAIACVFGLILAIFILSFLFGGRISHRRGPFLMSIWMFIFMILYSGFPIACMIMEMTKGVADAFTNYMFNVIAVGTSLICMVALIVIHDVFMRDRIFMKDLKAIEEYKAKMEARKAAIPVSTPAFANGQPIQIIINTNSPETSCSHVVNEEGAEITIHTPEAEKPVAPQPVAPQPVVEAATPVGPTVINETKVIKREIVIEREIPRDIKSIGGHAFAKNTSLEVATIPSGITELGVGAFANCVNLRIVSIPASVNKIGYNCFFNCKKLERVNFQGTKKQWSQVKRGSNWLLNAGTTFVVCSDAKLSVDPLK